MQEKNLFIASVGQYNGSPHVRTIPESGKFFFVECAILGFGIRVTAPGNPGTHLRLEAGIHVPLSEN